LLYLVEYFLRRVRWRLGYLNLHTIGLSASSQRCGQDPMKQVSAWIDSMHLLAQCDRLLYPCPDMFGLCCVA
jgi:hypothetical protein